MSENPNIEQWKPPGGDVEAYQPPTAGQQTPQQARVDSVATVLHTAIQRASTLVLTPEQDAALNEDFPDEAFKPGASGKEHLIYIEHAFLRDRFNSVLGRGQWSMVRTRPHWAEEFRTAKGLSATRIYAEAALLIKGCYVGEAIGDMVYYPNNDSQNYGDAAEGAMTAAFRRCAKNFGVGLQAWKKDFGEGWQQRQRTGQPAPKPAQNTAPAGNAFPGKTTPKPQQNATSQPATSEKALGGATLKTREWMIAKLIAAFPEGTIQLWAVTHKILLHTEPLTNWPLSHVPTTGPGIRELMGKIQDWVTAQTENIDTDEDAPPVDEPAPAGDDWSTQPWASVVVTVPPAGSKKAEYLQNADTIGSLYAKVQNNDETARKRFWGLAKGWTPQPWVGSDGQTRQPSQNDLNCRAAFDAFLAWHDGNGGTQ